MTPSDRFDDLVASWLQRAGRVRAPRGTLEAVLDGTRATRPLPAWRARVAVPSMRRGPTVVVGSPVARRMALGGAILIVALAAALAVAGAMLLRAELTRTQLFVYVANPASLPSDFCIEGRDCRFPLAAWPGGRFLLAQQVGAENPEVVVAAPWPSTIVGYRMAPSGTRLAYARTQRNYPASCLQLLVVDLETGEERLISETVADSTWAFDASAPDADRLLFATGARCSDEPVGLFAFDTRTGSIDRLLDFTNVFGPLEEASFAFEPVWVHALHPDGQRLLISVASRVTYPQDTFIVPIEPAAVPVPVACGCGVAAGSWSPDGSQLVLDGGLGSIWLASDDGSDAREVEDSKFLGFSSSTSWSPDSTSIVYFGPLLDAGSAAPGRYSHGIFALDAGGGSPIQIARARFGYRVLGTAPRWSPGGEWIYWSDLDATWAVRPDGTDLRQLALPAQIDVLWLTVEAH